MNIDAEEKLKSIADDLKKGVAPQKETARSFLLWFNASRRGFRVSRKSGRDWLITE